MLLGGSVVGAYKGPEAWAKEAKDMGFAAATCPLPRGASESEAKDLVAASKAYDLAIAEVGVWKNVLSPDDAERRDNIAYAQERLALAEMMDVACCVNIAGALGPQWDGPYPGNYAADTYALIVDSVRQIIDLVKPSRAFYTLEPMPWMLPDGPDSYLKLIRDIDRKQFAVHMDYCNMLSSPQRFLNSKAFITECLTKLAPYIKSVHIKDAKMDMKQMPVRIEECPPGQGQLDWAHILKELHRLLPHDMPVLLEHMDKREDYVAAYQHVAAIAKAEGVPVGRTL